MVKARPIVETPTRRPGHEAATYVLRLATGVFHDVQTGGLRMRAAALTYLTLLSMVPLLAICFSVLKGFGIHNQLEPFLLDFLQPLGPQGHDVALKIVEFVDNIKVGVLGAVGVVLLIYGVISMMREIEASFNDIWRVRQSRSFVQRTRDYLSVLLIGPLFMSLSVLMTEAFRHASLTQEWLGINVPEGGFDGIAHLIPYALFTLSFTALYMFMPNTTVKFWPALVAGAMTAVMWKLLGWLFGVFVAGSASYAAIYSVFAAIMLLMIWVYNAWLIVLVGASLAYYLQNPSNYRIARYSRVMSWRVREKTALMICGETGHAFYAGDPPPTILDLTRKLGMPAQIVTEVVETLVKSGVIVAVGKGGRQYIPGCPFDTVTVADMLDKIMLAEEVEGFRYNELKAPKQTETALHAADVAVKRELAKFTLKQLSGGSQKS